MVADVDEGYAEFCEYHNMQLKNIGLPEHAWRQVYEKLRPRTVDDIDSAMRVEGNRVVATKPLKLHSCVFIVPHKFSGDGGADMFATLENNIEHPAKLIELLGEIGQVAQRTDTDTEYQLETVVKLTGCTRDVALTTYNKCNGDLVYTIDSICHNTTESDAATDKIKQSVAGNIPNKPAILTYAEFQSALTERHSEHTLQLMYNDYVRKKQAEIGDDGQGTTDKYRWEDDTEEHIVTVRIPVPAGTTRKDVISKVTTRHWTFGIRGQPPIIYGNFQGTVEPDECTWYFERETGNIIASIQKGGSEVFLWKSLIVGEDKVNANWVVSERKRKILRSLDTFWHKGLTYQAITPEGKQAHNWYLPCQTLSAVPHADKPSLKLAPFWSCYGGKIFTLVWPVATINVGDACTLNRYAVLFDGETEIQRAARHWVCEERNASKPLPEKFSAQYETLLPPHSHSPSDWQPSEDNVVQNVTDFNDTLTVRTTMKLSESERAELRELGITISADAAADAHLTWVEGRADRSTDTAHNVNRFDKVLTNLIRLNEYIRSSLGVTEWWAGGYHLNKELPALLAASTSFSNTWVVRDTENTASTHVTSHLPRIARMCENSLNYFAQPYIDSMSVEHCQCSLEYTVLITDRTCWISDIPALHKARLEVSAEETYYNTDYFIPRSDGSSFPSIPWSKFLVEYSLKSSEPWPAQDIKIQKVIHDLLADFTTKCTEPHCYGVQVVITPALRIRVVGINATPTYFPSLPHLAAVWRMLAHNDTAAQTPTVQGFRKL